MNNKTTIRIKFKGLETAKDALVGVEEHEFNLKYIKFKTKGLVLKAVRKNGNALVFADKYKKDAAVVMEAVKQNGLALECAAIQTEEIVLTAVRQNGNALLFVWDEFITEEVCLEAVKQSNYALEYVLDKTMFNKIARLLNIETYE